MSERLVARISVSRPPDGRREEWPAYCIRSGMAIHIASPAREDPVWYAVSHVRSGYRMGLFDSIENAERALIALETVTDWTAIEDPKAAAVHRSAVEDVLFDCGEIRRRGQ